MGYLILLLAVCGPVGWVVLAIWLIADFIVMLTSYITKSERNGRHDKIINNQARKELKARGHLKNEDKKPIVIDRYP